MKNLKAFFVLAVVFALAASSSLAAKKKDKGGVELKNKEVSFKSDSKGKLTIRNQTSEDLILFAGRIEKGNLMGGVSKASNRVFDLASVSGIPRSGSLLIRAATFETYKRKIRLTEDDVVFTGLVVFNLDDPGDRSDISIFDKIDTQQQTCIYVSNMSSNYVLELRKDTPAQGEVIATLPPLLQNKRIYLEPRDDGMPYAFFPTFIYVNPKTGEKTPLPLGDPKKSRKTALPEAVGGEVTVMRFEPTSGNAPGYTVSFVSLSNDTDSGIIFNNAQTVLADQQGRRFTASGRKADYELVSDRGPSGTLYTGLSLEFDDLSTKRVGDFTFLPGYKYELHVTSKNGSYEYDIRELGKKSLVEDARISLFGE